MQMRLHPEDTVIQIASMKILVSLAEMGGGYAAAAANHEVQDGCKATLMRLGKGRTVPAIQIRNMYAKYRRAIAGSGVGISSGSGVERSAIAVGSSRRSGGLPPMTPRQKIMMTTGTELRDRIEVFLRDRQACAVEEVAQEWIGVAQLDRDVSLVQTKIKEKKVEQERLRAMQHYDRAAHAKQQFEELHTKLAKCMVRQTEGVRLREQLRRANTLVSEGEQRIVELGGLMQRVAALDDDARAAEISRERNALVDSVERVKGTCDFMVQHTPPSPVEVRAIQGGYKQVVLAWKDSGNSCDGHGACAVRYRVYVPQTLSKQVRKGSVHATTPKGGRRPSGYKGADWHSLLKTARQVKWVSASRNGLKCAFETNTMSNGKGQSGVLVKRSSATPRGGLPKTPRGGGRRTLQAIKRRDSSTGITAPATFGTGGQLNVPPPAAELAKFCRVTFDNLDATQLHRFCVTAVSARGMESAFSEHVEVQPLGDDYVRPPPPGHVSSARKGLNQLMVMWGAKHCTRGDPNAGYYITCEPADILPIVVWGQEVHRRDGAGRRVTQIIEPRRECLAQRLSEKPYSFSVTAIPLAKGSSVFEIKERFRRASESAAGRSLFDLDDFVAEEDKLFASKPSMPSAPHAPHSAVSLRTPGAPLAVTASSRGDGESIIVKWRSHGSAADGSKIACYTIRVCGKSRMEQTKRGKEWNAESGEPWSMTVQAPRTSVILSRLKLNSVVGGFEVIATCYGEPNAEGVGEGGIYPSRLDGPIPLGMSSVPSTATGPVRVTAFVEFDGHTGPWEHICDFKWKRRTPWQEPPQNAHEENALVHLLMKSIGEGGGVAPWTIAEMDALQRAFNDETAQSDLDKHCEMLERERAALHVKLCKMCTSELGWEERDADDKVTMLAGSETSDSPSVSDFFPDSAQKYIAQCKSVEVALRKRTVEERNNSRKHKAAINGNALEAVQTAGLVVAQMRRTGRTLGRRYDTAVAVLLKAKEDFTRAAKEKRGAGGVGGGTVVADAPAEDAPLDAAMTPEEVEQYEQERWDRISARVPGRTQEECKTQLRARDCLTTANWDFRAAMTMAKTGSIDLPTSTMALSATKSERTQKKRRGARGSVPVQKNGAPVWEARLPKSDKGGKPSFVEPAHKQKYSALYLYRDARGHWLIDGSPEGVAHEWGHIGIVGVPRPPKLIGGEVDPATRSLAGRLVQFFDDVARHVSDERIIELVQKHDGRETELIRSLEKRYPGHKVPRPRFIGGVPPEVESTDGMIAAHPVPTSNHIMWRYRKSVPTEGTPGRPMRSDPDMECNACLPTTDMLSDLSAAVILKYGDARAAFEAMNEDGDDFVERDEIESMLDTLDLPGDANLYLEQIDEIIAGCDENMDGQISFQEFWEALFPAEDDEADAAEERELAALFTKVRNLLKDSAAGDDVDQVDLNAVGKLFASDECDLGRFQVCGHLAARLCSLSPHVSRSHIHPSHSYSDIPKFQGDFRYYSGGVGRRKC